MQYFLKVSWCDSINIRTITNKLSIEFLINHCFSPDILVLQVSRMLSWKPTYSRKANIWICVGHVDKCGWWNPIKYVKDLNHQCVVVGQLTHTMELMRTPLHCTNKPGHCTTSLVASWLTTGHFTYYRQSRLKFLQLFFLGADPL